MAGQVPTSLGNVVNYPSALRNFPEERGSHLQLGGILKSRKIQTLMVLANVRNQWPFMWRYISEGQSP
jgi:hypothetical protein